MAPSLLEERKKCKSGPLHWHSWAKDLGAFDMKPPWESMGTSQCGLEEKKEVGQGLVSRF